MSGRVLLVDSDIFAILAAAELLQELAAALAIKPADLRRLPALPHQLRKGRSLQRRLTEEQRQRAIALAEAITPLNDRPCDDSLIEQLSVENIDPGEALLFATLCEQSAWLLTTGDRRSLIALGSDVRCETVRARLAGRILALESALVLIVRRLGAAETGRRLLPLCKAHHTLDILFGHKTTFDDVETFRQLDSYLRDLQQHVGTDLLFPLD